MSFFRLPRRFGLPSADPDPIRLRSFIDGKQHNAIPFTSLGRLEEPRSAPNQLNAIEYEQSLARVRQQLAIWGFSPAEIEFWIANVVEDRPLRELPGRLRADSAEIQRLRKRVERKFARIRFQASQNPDFDTLSLEREPRK